jgi:FkbM family methyltransferase
MSRQVSPIVKAGGRIVRGLLPAPLAGRILRWRARAQVERYRPRTVTRQFGDGPLHVYLSDPVADEWYDRDWAELPEVALMRESRLRTSATVFDIGAHQAVIAMMLAREVGPEGQVVAVEPNAHNAKAALKNCELNGLRQIKVIQAAVSDGVGRIYFNERLNGQIDDGTGVAGRVEVAATTIDALVEQFGVPDVVYLDIEGAEVLALHAAKSSLGGSTDFFIEVHVGCGLEQLGGTVNELLAFFPVDRFDLFGRAPSNARFTRLRRDDPATRERFFLFAKARSVSDNDPLGR